MEKTEFETKGRGRAEFPSFLPYLPPLLLRDSRFRHLLLCKEIYADKGTRGFKQLLLRFRRQCGAVFQS